MLDISYRRPHLLLTGDLERLVSMRWSNVLRRSSPRRVFVPPPPGGAAPNPGMALRVGQAPGSWSLASVPWETMKTPAMRSLPSSEMGLGFCGHLASWVDPLYMDGQRNRRGHDLAGRFSRCPRQRPPTRDRRIFHPLRFQHRTRAVDGHSTHTGCGCSSRVSDRDRGDHLCRPWQSSNSRPGY